MPPPGRMQQSFPSRQYSHGRARSAGLVARPPLAAGVYRFVLGRDAAPVLLHAGAADLPRDPFATLVLFGGGPLPASLRSLQARSRTSPDSRSRSSAVSSSPTAARFHGRRDRRSAAQLPAGHHEAGRPAAQPDVLISASTDLDSTDLPAGVRLGRRRPARSNSTSAATAAWIWAGSSWDALAPGSRGHGPFDSHVNGALNMKELKLPWVHWHSQAAAILDDVLAPEIRCAPNRCGRQKAAADEFERTVVRPGIQRWTDSAVHARIDQGGSLTQPHEFFRQVLEHIDR